ncbi:MAG: DUF4339 domain-containing protein [Planctomycetes bacterium]|nr:DUF4339 domain-containing protein [Planctomycetota bacterium]
MATQWYLTRDGQRMGPYSGEQLHEFADDGRLSPKDLVWCEGMTDWVEARKVLKPARLDRTASRRREDDDFEDDSPARAPTGPKSEFPGRLITPGFFVIALLMFFLPWIEVRCNGFPVISQSGLQASVGAYSETLFFAQEKQNRAQMGMGFRLVDDEKAPVAPLLLLYGAIVLAGIVLGLVLRAGTGRMAALGSCGAVAFFLMIIQLSIGFPIAKQVAKANADQNLRKDFQNVGQFPFPVPLPQGQVPQGQMPQFPMPMIPPGGDFVWISTTPWFWLGVIFTLGSLGGIAIEHWLVFAKLRRAPRY